MKMKMTIKTNNAQGRLDSLAIGSEAVIGQPDHSSPTILRLMEMGLCAGARVRMTRRAPAGDPIEIEVRDTRLCLRRSDARAFPIDSATEPEPAR
jgi:Fe2+ transport system protein FeoA